MKYELDFGDDLSVSRATAWIPLLGHVAISLGIGWPAGPIGAIGFELSNHGRTGVAGEAISIVVDGSPTTTLANVVGTADKALIVNIQPKGALYGRAIWTPGPGNSGTGKHFTDDSGTGESFPILGLP